jgi:hypothetical protein
MEGGIFAHHPHRSAEDRPVGLPPVRDGSLSPAHRISPWEFPRRPCAG